MTEIIKLDLVATPEIQKYFETIHHRVEQQFSLATKAREQGLDYSMEVETLPAADLADRTEKIIGPKGIAQRYRDLIIEKKGDRTQTMFEIFKEIIEQKWCEIPDRQKRLEQAIKSALMLNTEGVVVAPLDGVPKVLISQNFDGSEYVDIYYAGPIRAAGGTSAVLPLILGDYGRILLGLDKFKPTEDEIERYVEETEIYEEIFSRQYRLKTEEVRKIIRGCPVCINGEPTEEREVALHRDLKRVPNNRVRGGACLVISEGIALKARKILNFSKMLSLNWSWLEDIISVTKDDGKKKIKPDAKYLEGVAAGRPIFSYPSRPGGFRLRYGRTRAMGIMAKAIHPATMYALDEFAAIGTQIKLERPGKATSITACDTIDGPIVLLENGSVVQLKTVEQTQKVKEQIHKILFLGDMLVCFGDFRFSSHPLLPAGYNHDWWMQEIKKAGYTGEKVNELTLSWTQALEFTQKYSVPLHPKFTAYYSLLNKQEFLDLVKKLHAGIFEKNEFGNKILKLEKETSTKGWLEKIGLEHKILDNWIVFNEEISQALEFTFGIGKILDFEKLNELDSNLKILETISGIQIRDKAGTFLGSRMGRPESSSEREMKGNPHCLFPIGNNGGSIRSINKASEKNNGKIEVELAMLKCLNCNTLSNLSFCSACQQRTTRVRSCKNCGMETLEEKCPSCKMVTRSFSKRTIDLKEEFIRATQKLNIKIPDIVKGVKGVINQDRIAEPIEKGILRAKHDLHMFRDGTLRYELINLPITHFKPKEIEVSIEKLKQLGYTQDVDGNGLENSDQVIEIKPQDIIVHEGTGDFFLRVSQFVDEELQRLYGLPTYYNAQTKEDLIGEIILGLAPHTSAAIVGRILGYTKARGGFAHPFFHQVKRRNCDGEQDSYMLLLDGLINFSQAYLPETRGGRMDAPLVFTIALKPTEIDDEVYNMDIGTEYPLELYEKALQYAMPDAVQGIKIVQQTLNKPEQYSGLKFTHSCSRFEEGPYYSKYVKLKSMEEKVRLQAKLQSRIMAVDCKDSIERVLVSHFLPDCIGNMRSFSRQQFRCTSCNAKFRRIPLSGKCTCKEGNLILTISQGSIRKYIDIAKDIIVEYKLSDYLRQRMDLIEEEVDSVFNPEKTQQRSLSEFF
ncbi:MAG: DNA polymerase II large subunit [Candidatus Diapherotrites archaeon]|nr:DNA polymerase II large subunit [Candidatus Diapherotrites archaeon]